MPGITRTDFLNAVVKLFIFTIDLKLTVWTMSILVQPDVTSEGAYWTNSIVYKSKDEIDVSSDKL